MKEYNFHGTIELSEIGKELRTIAKLGEDFKILTGYGASVGVSKSKEKALNSLRKMKKEGLIKDFIPGDKINSILGVGEYFTSVKIKYQDRIRLDSDAKRGNPGMIFVFVR